MGGHSSETLSSCPSDTLLLNHNNANLSCDWIRCMYLLEFGMGVNRGKVTETPLTLNLQSTGKPVIMCCRHVWAFIAFLCIIMLSLSHSMIGGDLSNELVRHFLIECTQKGVRLKGCPNEPYFGECLLCSTRFAIPFWGQWQHNGDPCWLLSVLIFKKHNVPVCPLLDNDCKCASALKVMFIANMTSSLK
jgi:hypothetical protein